MSMSLYQPLKRRRTNNYHNKNYGLIGRGMPMTAVPRFTNSPYTYRRAPYLNTRTAPALLAAERKWYDTAIAASTIPVGGATATGLEMDPSQGCLSAPAQGDSPSNRNGQKIVITSVSLKGIITLPTAINQTICKTAPAVFLCLYQDTQTNGVQCGSEDVFVNLSGDTRMNTTLMRNQENMKRFKILDAKTITLPQAVYSWDGANIEQGGSHTPFYLKWKGKIPVTFTTASTTASVSYVTDNSVHIIAACSNQDSTPNILYGCRIRFYG